MGPDDDETTGAELAAAAAAARITAFRAQERADAAHAQVARLKRGQPLANLGSFEVERFGSAVEAAYAQANHARTEAGAGARAAAASERNVP
jgi:hypothetical protein